ncbi:MAG: hypothetical protein V2A34_05485 [Lentisphaerota bacterium]
MTVLSKTNRILWLAILMGSMTAAPLFAQTDAETSAPKIAPSSPQEMGTPDTRSTSGGDYKWPGIALGAKIGTLGLGGDLTIGLFEVFNIRGGVNYANFSFNGTVRDIKYNYGVDYLSFPILADIHPFRNNFRISAGVLLNQDNKVKLDAAPNKNVTIGDDEYTPAQIGILNGTIKFTRNAAPYVGIGFGNAVKEDTSWSFIFDLGVVFQTYDVELTSRGGTMSDNPAFLLNLAKEEADVQDDFDKFEIYPVLSFGVGYHF